MAVMKEIGAKWLADMADYISNNPQFIVNGFLHAGISEALDEMTDNDTPVPYSDETETVSTLQARRCFCLLVLSCLPLKINLPGISNPPCGRSEEYLLRITTQSIVPFFNKKQ